MDESQGERLNNCLPAAVKKIKLCFFFLYCLINANLIRMMSVNHLWVVNVYAISEDNKGHTELPPLWSDLIDHL